MAKFPKITYKSANYPHKTLSVEFSPTEFLNVTFGIFWHYAYMREKKSDMNTNKTPNYGELFLNCAKNEEQHQCLLIHSQLLIIT